MGVVYSAYDEELDRKVAIKVVRSTVAKATRERAFREAKALAKLNHKNVVAVYDVGTFGQEIWIAMEFVTGQTLTAWAAERRRPWREVLRVITEVAGGVAAAHAAGLVHRDLKPDNVMMGDDGHPRVLDFGLAHTWTAPTDELSPGAAGLLRSSPTLSQTRSGVVRGTPGYMAPEQWEGSDVGAAADQFGWSVTAWELLYGERPFADVDAMLSGRRRTPPAGTAAPAWLRRVVERGLAIAPVDRHADMTAVIAALAADPTRRRRMLGAGLLVLFGAGVVLGARHLDQRAARAACVEVGAGIAETWGDEARITLHDALVATGASFAATTFEKIRPQLDAYADSWRDARTRACTASSVDRTLTPEQAELRGACLDEARQHLDSLLVVLSTPDSKDTGKSVVQRAVKAVSLLPRLAACEDDDPLRARPRPPDDDDSRTEVRRIRGVLARAAALAATGQTTQGLTIIDEAAPVVVAVGWAPLQAETDLQRGNLLAIGGKYDEAKAALEAAYYTSGAVQADEIQFEAADLLAGLLGKSLARPDDGLLWARTARMLLERGDVPPDDPRWAALSRHFGFIYGEMGKNDDGVAMHQKALDLHERLHGSLHPEVASDLSNLGNLHRLNGDFERAIECGRRALDLKESMLGPDHPGVADTLGNLGAIHLQMGNNQRALELITRALGIHERALGPEHPTVAISLNNISVIHTNLGQRDLAVAAQRRALAIREKVLGPNHPDVATSLLSLADDLTKAGDLDAGLELANRALSIWEASFGPDHQHVARALHSIATIHGSRGDHSRAVDLLRRSVEIQEHALGLEHGDLIVPLIDLGLSLIETGDLARARTHLERAVNICEKEPGRAGNAGEARFALARALWPEKPQRARVRQITEQAIADMDGAGPRFAADAAEARRWLKDR